MSLILRHCRSLLFLPASNPRMVEKARGLPADLVILDCEDAVRPEDKASARAAAVAAAQAGFGDRICAIRINAAGTPWHEEDLAAAAASAADYVVLPKTEAGAGASRVAAAGKPLLAMIESPGGVLAAGEIASTAEGLIVGTNDLASSLGVPADPERTGLTYCLQAIILAARTADAAVFDGVWNDLEDDAGLEAECRQGRRFGFDGKSVIHPRQIEIVNRIFSPTEAEIAAAERIIASATGGAERFEGRMIEAMHVSQAKALLARARRC